MSIHDGARRGFEQGAHAYERGRPGYPTEAIEWLTDRLRLGPGRTLLDVGAGTGKLTRELVTSGATVVAVEPVPAMRAVLEQAVPSARALEGTAEALPVGDRTVDAIVVAQAFHWFDGRAAVAEFHRVLRPRGRLGVIWNRRLRDQPLHRAIGEIVEPYRGDTPSRYGRDWRGPITSGGLFVPTGELEVPYEQVLDADGLVDRVGSTSFIAALSDAVRARVLERVRGLATEGPARLGYLTEAYVFQRDEGPRLSKWRNPRSGWA
jgi:SAM-dependent methyltransferase